MTLLEMLKQQLDGRRFLPREHPSLGGVVKDVHQYDSGETTWLRIQYENPEDGSDGGYSLFGFHDQFDLAPDIVAELSNCPTHGAVDKDHRCPEFDGVLRDAWTGDVIPDGPADNVKYLGFTENGIKYTP